MKRTTLLVPALCLTLALTGCVNSSTPPGATDLFGSDRSISAARYAALPRRDRGPSWFAKDAARNSRLLFVSDAATGDVYLYRIPSLKLVGKTTGFSQPQGECSDRHGDVWVTDSSARTIYELSHGGELKNTLTDESGYPVGCAWDQSTGNLAVMNFFGFNTTAGSVLVYPDASGSPKTYANPNQYDYDFGAYDSHGDLFFDGQDSSGNFMLSELHSGASSAQTIKISGGTIYFPGMVQWVGSRLVVGDQSCTNKNSSCLFQLSVSGSSGTIEGQIALANSTGGQVCDMAQGVVVGKRVLGSDNDYCGYAASATYSWAYPGGGTTSIFDAKIDSAPIGAALSTK